MQEQTLETVLRARGDDPRALRGAILITQGGLRIVFGAVGDHRRFSVAVHGDELNLVDDPRTDGSQAVSRQTEENEDADKDGDGESKPAAKRTRAKT